MPRKSIFCRIVAVLVSNRLHGPGAYVDSIDAWNSSGHPRAILVRNLRPLGRPNSACHQQRADESPYVLLLRVQVNHWILSCALAPSAC